jgi:proline iminopeptidase
MTFTISSPCYRLEKPSLSCLYPISKPTQEGMLAVSHGHQIWFAEFGNPKGIPVITVHGGPGGGSTGIEPGFFDPQQFRIIVFDQRGCGRSRPHGETTYNTTPLLIADMEALREHLGISQWMLFGGSWGSALSIAYGQTHPDRCLGFVLRGIFLGTGPEFMKLWHDMGDFYPEAFKECRDFIPKAEQHNLCQAFHRRLIDPDPAIHMPAALAFYKYDVICATLFDKSSLQEMHNHERVLALSRLFAHYCVNDFYFGDQQLSNNIPRIAHLPAHIVHGRYDIICRPSSAYHLHESWTNSSLTIVCDAGHSVFEPGIMRALVEGVKDIQAKIFR